MERHGSGSAYSKAGTAQGLSTVDIHAQAAGQLYPGVNGDVIVKLSNPNPYPVHITSISNGSGGITADLAGCVNTGVTFNPPASVDWTVPANDSAQFTLAGAAHMSNSSDDGCQGAVFTIPVTFSGASSATS